MSIDLTVEEIRFLNELLRIPDLSLPSRSWALGASLQNKFEHLAKEAGDGSVAQPEHPAEG